MYILILKQTDLHLQRRVGLNNAMPYANCDMSSFTNKASVYSRCVETGCTG